MLDVTGYCKISTNVGEFTTALTKIEILERKKEAQSKGEMLEIETFITEGPFLGKLCTFKHKVSLDLNHVAILSIEEITDAQIKESNYETMKKNNPDIFTEAENEAGEKLLNSLVEVKARVLISDFESAFEQENKELILKLAVPEALRIIRQKSEVVKQESE